MKKRILFVDDDENILRILRLALKKMENLWDMDFVGSALEALKMLGINHYDLIVTDYKMPVMDGFELLKETKKKYRGVKRVFLTGNLNVEEQLPEIAHKYLIKNESLKSIEKEIEEILND